MSDWMEEVRISINPSKVKRLSKISWYALYRKFGHKTVGGKGLIARLRKKKKR